MVQLRSCTCEFARVDATQCQFSIADGLGCQVKTEQRWQSLGFQACKKPGGDRRHALDAAERVWVKGWRLVRDEEQADVRHRDTADSDRVRCATQRELPVVSDDRIDANPGPESDAGFAPAVDECRALVRVELHLVCTSRAAESACKMLQVQMGIMLCNVY